jgi:hypothetical protein
MAFFVGKSGSYNTGKFIYVWSSSAWKLVQTAWVWSSGAWKLVYSALTITGVPATFSKLSSVTIRKTGGDINVGLSGGVAPYSMTLTKLSGPSNFVIAIGGPVFWDENSLVLAQNTTSGSGAAVGTVRITITDSIGAVATADSTLTIS